MNKFLCILFIALFLISCGLFDDNDSGKKVYNVFGPTNPLVPPEPTEPIVCDQYEEQYGEEFEVMPDLDHEYYGQCVNDDDCLPGWEFSGNADVACIVIPD